MVQAVLRRGPLRDVSGSECPIEKNLPIGERFLFGGDPLIPFLGELDMKLPKLTLDRERNNATNPNVPGGVVPQGGCEARCQLIYQACQAATGGSPLCGLAYTACLATCG